MLSFIFKLLLVGMLVCVLIFQPEAFVSFMRDAAHALTQGAQFLIALTK